MIITLEQARSCSEALVRYYWFRTSGQVAKLADGYLLDEARALGPMPKEPRVISFDKTRKEKERTEFRAQDYVYRWSGGNFEVRVIPEGSNDSWQTVPLRAAYLDAKYEVMKLAHSKPYEAEIPHENVSREIFLNRLQGKTPSVCMFVC